MAVAVLTLGAPAWFRDSNQQPSITTAAAGMLEWLLALQSCGTKLEKAHADRVATALLPMLQTLSALAQHYSCTPALCSYPCFCPRP